VLQTRLNAAALTDELSLIVSLSSDSVPSFRTLIDSGSTDSFMDISFAEKMRIPKLRLQHPLQLVLFDGSSPGQITHFVTIPIRFPSGKRMSVDFLLTKLDPSCLAVLGYRWLARYNPTIDWARGHISFQKQAERPSRDHGTGDIPEPSGLSEAALRAAAANISVRFIGAAAFRTACRMKGAYSSAIRLKDPAPETSARSASFNPASETGENIPEEYHDFLDRFSSGAASRLPIHRPWDLKIDLDDAKAIPTGPIYNLSETELFALREYLQRTWRKDTSVPRPLPVVLPYCSSRNLTAVYDFASITAN
jgi:Retroviral aspartyl protease